MSLGRWMICRRPERSRAFTIPMRGNEKNYERAVYQARELNVYDPHEG